MAESMFDMMDAFSSAYQKQMKGRDNSWANRQPSQSTWLEYRPTWNAGSLPFIPGGQLLPPTTAPWSPGNMNYMPDPRIYSRDGVPHYLNWRPTKPGPLDGDWIDSVGSILSVKNGRFQISQSSDRYSEGYLSFEKAKMLSMRSRNSNHKRYYEYVVQQDKLVLRDRSGNLLLFRRRNSW